MKILLAPAETKQEGGNNKPLILKNFQKEPLEQYEKYVTSASLEELSSWFGLKKLDEVKKYKTTIKDKSTLKAIQRYTGVAFEAIDYQNLSNEAQQYCDKNILIFSNLFGVLNGDDFIPNYKFKQGQILPTLDTIKYFKEKLKPYLDEKLLNQEILDLRAGFYDKFYKITYPYVTMKFLKDGKVVSHWAKHYRGHIVNIIASNNISTISELMNFNIQNLSIVEIKKQKNKTEIVYNID